ncbi:Cysteine-rich protein 2-binding protein [Nymphon striatum]|nr:Cysteine-rich protein 2-binding protein [Nymphon striatum]
MDPCKQIDSLEMCLCDSPCIDADDRIKCQICKRFFHLRELKLCIFLITYFFLQIRNVHASMLIYVGCLDSPRPSDLTGDIFFNLTCRSCNNGEEVIERIKLKWVHVIAISLYNLQLHHHGKCGYFQWREHICDFIVKHWKTFYGSNRHKYNNMNGTIAGCLSHNCPEFFESGTSVLKESGWWKLSKPRLSDLFTPEKICEIKKIIKKPYTKRDSLPLQNICSNRTRKRTQNSFEAAMQLKEKKASTKEAKDIRKEQFHVSEAQALIVSPAKVPCVRDSEVKSDFDSKLSGKKGSQRQNLLPSDRNEKPGSLFPVNVGEEDLFEHFNGDVGCLDADAVNSKSENFLLDFSDVFHGLSSVSPECDGTITLKNEIKSENISDSETKDIDDNEDNKSSVTSSSSSSNTDSSETKPHSKYQELLEKGKENIRKFHKLVPYEEQQLLDKLNCNVKALEKCPQARMLQRKLILRQIKRERNMKVFELDEAVRTIQAISNVSDATNLRFQNILVKTKECLDPIISPFTSRILKPYIWRNYESCPLKLQLNQEIRDYYNKRNNIQTFQENSPIDFCYVRPEHIPIINHLCSEFFWPGINMSDFLGYPDFSVVAMYRKLIIGFGFMIADAKVNEAYITYLFTHPDWRRAKIGTFMLYHLIQTCMGKDITLHVSSSNPAMVLYQDFGFKSEEFIKDFYDKFFPFDSKKCRHAVFMRLKR